VTRLVYDTGALIAAESSDRRMWAMHRRALERHLIPLVPAGVLAEAWRGGPAAELSRFLKGTDTVALTDQRARSSGKISAQCAEDHGAVDASVVQAAVENNAAVVTSNRAHIEDLANSSRRRINVIEI
jgi:predicted nucleic acid-binding protein